MKDKEKAQKLIDELKALAESDFERHRIAVLEKDLTEPPKVEIIDDKHQKFNGLIFTKENRGGHYRRPNQIHRCIYEYYFGEIPTGYLVHHRDFNPKNNSVDNLQLVTKSEHGQIHTTQQIPLNTKTYTCKNCGKSYETTDNGNRNQFCSLKCRRQYNYHNSNQAEKICKVCGTKFLSNQGAHKKTCSADCEKILHNIYFKNI